MYIMQQVRVQRVARLLDDMNFNLLGFNAFSLCTHTNSS